MQYLLMGSGLEKTTALELYQIKQKFGSIYRWENKQLTE